VTSMQMHLHRNPTVITQLRDPVDRLLSAYEFAVEVALRMALKPPAQRHQNRERPQPPPMPGRPGRPDRKLPQKRNATRTDTVWPWSQIVPMMLEDIVQRYLDGGCVASFAISVHRDGCLLRTLMAPSRGPSRYPDGVTVQ
jgi:hypothetical protein